LVTRHRPFNLYLSIYSHIHIGKNTIEVNGYLNCLVTNSLVNIIFCL